MDITEPLCQLWKNLLPISSDVGKVKTKQSKTNQHKLKHLFLTQFKPLILGLVAKNVFRRQWSSTSSWVSTIVLLHLRSEIMRNTSVLCCHYILFSEEWNLRLCRLRTSVVSGRFSFLFVSILSIFSCSFYQALQLSWFGIPILWVSILSCS